MRDTDLFQMALGIADPWIVESAEFDPEKKRLDIRINFRRGGTFSCPACGVCGCKAHDTVEKTWRHLNFFQHETKALHDYDAHRTSSGCALEILIRPFHFPPVFL